MRLVSLKDIEKEQDSMLKVEAPLLWAWVIVEIRECHIIFLYQLQCSNANPTTLFCNGVWTFFWCDSCKRLGLFNINPQIKKFIDSRSNYVWLITVADLAGYSPQAVTEVQTNASRRGSQPAAALGLYFMKLVMARASRKVGEAAERCKLEKAAEQKNSLPFWHDLVFPPLVCHAWRNFLTTHNAIHSRNSYYSYEILQHSN